jgi:hypothetical protein
LSTISLNRSLRRYGLALLAAAAVAGPALAEDIDYEVGGHVKGWLSADRYPSESLLNALAGSTASALETEFRVNFTAERGAWSLDSAWQFYAGYGDRIELARDLGGTTFPGAGYMPNDDSRLMNLTDVLRDDGKTVALQRLDRLALTHSAGNLVLKAGRQAISWGNGLLFSPMDIVNPFDPTAVDTEYKAGDDMLYGQFLRENGDDIQFAHVFRRNPLTGRHESAQATSAVKYHGVVGDSEYDLLLARHYDVTTVGAGGNRSIGGAVLRGDVVVADGDAGTDVQVVINLSYSWLWGGRNVSGLVEYYFAGFGQGSGRYAAEDLAQNPELLARVLRGESFTLARNYLAGGLTIEMSPLWLLTPNLFVNLDDGSALFQGVTRLSLGDNSEFLGALNVPLGPSGTEFGGIPAPGGTGFLSTDLALFAQFAWYF